MPEPNRDNQKQIAEPKEGEASSSPSSSGSALIVLLPLAVGVAMIVWAWRWLMALGVLLSIAGVWKYFQKKQQEHLERLNGIFYQLLEQHHGRLTTLDLAMGANISGVEAKEYLEQRARDFAADFEITDSGTVVYCFATVKAPVASGVKQLQAASEPLSKDYQPSELPKSLNQSQLAERLGVHPTTIAKRKSKSDFITWSRSKDPVGVAWTYSPDTKEFFPLRDS